MAVTMNNTSALAAKLVVSVTKAEYQPEVEKALKNVRKNVEEKGFRKGQAPMSMIVKKYGMAVKLDEINRLAGRQIYDYINDNKLRVLGEPLPVEGQNVADLEVDKDFEFTFEVALAPELDIKLTKEEDRKSVV